MFSDSRHSDGSGGLFTTTQWSLVLAAGDSGHPDSRQALASLCKTYWYPVYALIRRSGSDVSAAQDLAQGFFAEILEKRALQVADPDRGRFRYFLKATLQHYLSHQRRRERTVKRGGGRVPISLDFDAAESRYRLEPADTQTPETLFEKRWAHELLTRAHRRLREEMERGPAETKRFRRLEPFLTDQRPGQSYRDVATELEMTEAAVKKAVQRMRRRFGDLLRAEAAQTVHDPEEVDDEIRYLFTVLGA